ncbi:hypothetical protein GQ457_04G025690 [Hibiscus cannabinus]
MTAYNQRLWDFSGCPSLTTLSLYRCNITDTGLEALANACLALRCMNLAYCPHISDSGLSALSQGCCELQTIKISNCKGVTGVGLRGCSSTLVYVDADLFNLEPEGIMKSILYMNRDGGISNISVDLFKLYRCNVKIKFEEVISIVPNWDNYE